jgi:DNA-binding beta-propeller fold protein YncE
MEWGSEGTEDGRFLSPIGVAVDQRGNVYVIDDSRDDIQKFDENGRFMLKWGSHGSGQGQFNFTGPLTLDSQGNVLVADFANHRIQKFDSQGAFLTKWGTFGKATGEFNDPGGIAIDPHGNLYVIEYAAHAPPTYRVQIFDGEGGFLGTWGSPGTGNGEFFHPLAIAADSQGNIYVSDVTNRIQKFRLTNPLPSANASEVTSSLESFPSARCCNGTSLEPGEYELPSWVGIPLTMTLNEGWQVVNEERARLFMLGKGESMFNDPTQALVFIAIPHGNPETILTSIENEKGLTPQGKMAVTTIAGFSGLQLDFSANPNPDYAGDPGAEIPPGVQFLTSVGKYFAEGFFWTTWSAESRLRFIALNVWERVLLLQIDAPPTEFEAFASDAEQVLHTLRVGR